MMRPRFCLVILLYLTAMSSSIAQDYSVLGKDLLGYWAEDCSQPASTANPYIEFSIQDGSLMRSAFTDHQTSTYRVRTLSFGEGSIQFVFVGATGGDVVSVYADYEPGSSMRTIDAFVERSGQERQFGIRDRQELDSQRESIRVYKCPKAIF